MDKREEFQKKSHNKWVENNCIGTTVATTGTGKSKILIDCYKTHVDGMENSISIIFAPTLKLIKNWHAELDMWLGDDLIHNYKENIVLYKSHQIIFSTYSSTHKHSNKHYDFLGLDEIHNALSEKRLPNLLSINADTVKGLTATLPPKKEDQIKLNRLCPVISELNVKKSLKDNLIQDFNVHIIDVPLDNQDKLYKKFNNKMTEFEFYNSIVEEIEYNKLNNTDNLKWNYFNRMHFLYNTFSKIKTSMILLNYMKDKKVLVFTQSIINADLINKGKSYHNKSGDKYLDLFIEGKINILSSVKSLNEGITIPKLSHSLITSADSTEKNMVQRIGRTLRLKDNNIPSEIIILRHKTTVDNNWIKNALKKFPKSNIKTYKNFKEYLNTIKE